MQQLPVFIHQRGYIVHSHLQKQPPKVEYTLNSIHDLNALMTTKTETTHDPTAVVRSKHDGWPALEMTGNENT